MNHPDKEPEAPARRVAVTGAFGYSGRYIAQRLLAAGHDAFTLTNSPGRHNPFGEKLRALPFHFDQPARLEESLRGTDALINNIAWSLRHLPIFGVFGAGDYKLQPIYVDDLASAAVMKAFESRDETIEAIGPETFTYRGLVEQVRDTLGLKRPILRVPPTPGYWACRALGLLVHDVIITREEIKGLMEGRLCVDATPLGSTKLSDWIARHQATLGLKYTSEMARRLDRVSGYRSN